MPSSSYFPTKDAQVVTWANTFASVLSASPLPYGATPAIATAFQTLATNLENAYTTSQEPATRTKGTIASKNEARALMKEAARKIVRVIYAQTLTDQQLIDIGLRAYDPVPTPSPIPAAAPILEVVSVFGRQVRVKLKDASGERRGRPQFVAAAQLYSFVGATPPSGSDGWKMEACVTRTSIIVQFPETVAAGAKVYLTACWMNSRGLTGPACTPVVSQIGYEGAMPLAA
ncbi:MAG: hypothetical protein WBD40_16240 [Tepidisphaeraceae bacterium]